MKFFVLFLMLFIPFALKAQDTLSVKADTIKCAQTDVFEVLRKKFNKAPKSASVSTGSLFLIPIIGSNPATGFMAGIGGQYAFKRAGDETKYSVISGSAQLTTKGQKIFLLKNTIFSKNNKFFFSGDWRYMIYSQPTYGLGTKAPDGGILDYQYSLAGQSTTIDSLAQPLTYNFLRFYQSVSYNLTRNFYVGAGYYLDRYFNIDDEKLNLTPGDTVITSHYAYSQHYGFNDKHYATSVVGVNVVSDTRDNMINTYSGHYAMVSWHSSLGILTDKASNYFAMEWRSFHSLSKRSPRTVLALWMIGNFTAQGTAPYLILPATAYDQTSSSGRGYTQGRFRGNQYLYGESEYRFPISQCNGLWGGVLFLNATTTNNPQADVAIFDSVKPGGGFGFRLMVDKKSRTNLAIDFGFGEQSFGFYLSAGEVF
jgi:hypothetical protein